MSPSDEDDRRSRESKNGKYSGTWKEWLDENDQQYDGAVHGGDAIIERNMVTMIGVKFTQAARNAQGGWKLTAATKRRIEAANLESKWNTYK